MSKAHIAPYYCTAAHSSPPDRRRPLAAKWTLACIEGFHWRLGAIQVTGVGGREVTAAWKSSTLAASRASLPRSPSAPLHLPRLPPTPARSLIPCCDPVLVSYLVSCSPLCVYTACVYSHAGYTGYSMGADSRDKLRPTPTLCMSPSPIPAGWHWPFLLHSSPFSRAHSFVSSAVVTNVVTRLQEAQNGRHYWSMQSPFDSI